MLDFIVYYSAYTVKVFIDIFITKPDYFQSVFFQTISSDFVLLLFLQLIMTASIQFYDQTGFCAVKISNILVYSLLPLKPDRIFIQKAIP